MSTNPTTPLYQALWACDFFEQLTRIIHDPFHHKDTKITKQRGQENKLGKLILILARGFISKALEYRHCIHRFVIFVSLW
jgi:hypothetical protein